MRIRETDTSAWCGMQPTYADTFAPSFRSLAVLGVAARAESLKEEKYMELLQLTSMAVETSRV